MYKILIQKEKTMVYIDNGTNELSYRDNDKVMGFLINSNGIKELVESIPVSKYYIDTYKTGYKEITKQQALFAYDEILNYQEAKTNSKFI